MRRWAVLIRKLQSTYYSNPDGSKAYHNLERDYAWFEPTEQRQNINTVGQETNPGNSIEAGGDSQDSLHLGGDLDGNDVKDEDSSNGKVEHRSHNNRTDTDIEVGGEPDVKSEEQREVKLSTEVDCNVKIEQLDTEDADINSSAKTKTAPNSAANSMAAHILDGEM